jgi:hypothetical protein
LFRAVFLLPALSLVLAEGRRRSWRVLLISLVALALLVVGIVVVNAVFMASINPISGVNYALGTALVYAYVASIPFLITAAAACSFLRRFSASTTNRRPLIYNADS